MKNSTLNTVSNSNLSQENTMNSKEFFTAIVSELVESYRELSVSEVLTEFTNELKHYLVSTKRTNVKPSIDVDLTFDLAVLSYGQGNAADLDNEGQYFGDEDEERLSYEERSGLSIHKGNFLAQQERVGKNRNALARSVVKSKMDYITNVLKLDVATLSDEVVVLLGEQLKDLEVAPNASLKRYTESVYVTVQRLSKNGFWYNVKTKTGDKITYEFDIEDLFELDDDNAITGFKYFTDVTYSNREEVTTSTPSVLYIMKRYGYNTQHVYTSVNKETGDLEVNIIDQRFVLSSASFVPGTVIEDQTITSVCAPFNYAVLNNKTVIKQRTSYSYDSVNSISWKYRETADGKIESHKNVVHITSIVDFDNGIVLIPSDKDETFGASDIRKFDKGILTGTSVATSIMMMDDMQREHVEENAKLERDLKNISAKAKTSSYFKQEAIKQNVEDILASEIGMYMEELVVGSHLGLENKSIMVATINKIKAEPTKLKDIKRAAIAYRSKYGKGLSYPVWTILLKLIAEQESKTIEAKAVVKLNDSVLKDISSLNNGKLSVDRLSTERIVEIYSVALAYWKINNGCRLEHSVAKKMAAIYAQAKGVKTANAKPRSSQVHDVKVS